MTTATESIITVLADHAGSKAFYIGTTNIYDYQAEGFYYWASFSAAETSVLKEAFAEVTSAEELVTL